MSFSTLNGILLKTHPYSDNAVIANVFTQQMGVVGVFVRQSNAKSGGGNALITPMNEVEILVTKGQGSLWRCHECRLISGYLGLRNSWETLQTAIELLNTVAGLHIEETPSPLLYTLLKDYLHRLEEGELPWKIISSFYLKILRLEGLWDDSLPEEVAFSHEEWLVCVRLAYCKTKLDLDTIQAAFPDVLKQKVVEFYHSRIG